jgi:hypothetical protein
MSMVMHAPAARRTWSLAFLPLAASFLILLGIAAYGILRPADARPAPPAPGFHGALVWGDGIFSNPAQLKAWIRLHGGSYPAWVAHHPAGVRLLKPPAHNATRATHRKLKATPKPK